MPVPRPHPTRRQAAAAVLAVGAVAAVGLAITSGGAGAAARLGPTAEAATRSLQVTTTESGILGRADTTNVLYDGTGGSANGGPAGSNVSAQSAGAATLASIATDVCIPSSLGTSPTTSSSTSTSTSSTTAPSTTSTTAAPPCPPTTTPPTTPSTAPATPPTSPPSSDQGQDGDDGAGPGPGGAGPSSPTGSDGRSSDDSTGGGPAKATLTEVIAIGETAGRGSVLYRADDEPIVALLAPDPLFRDLRTGATDGPDVAALEANLVALGYGSGVTVDQHFDAGTAAAVRRWEEALGRSAPDGVVTVGEVVYLAEPTAVLEHSAAVGDLLEPGDGVLVLGAESRIIDTDVLADDVGDWPVGTTVTVDWGDGTSTTGSVVEVGRDVVSDEVALVIALADGTGADRPIGSQVDVVRTVAERDGVTAVPVAAVVAGPDGPAVRVAGQGADRLVGVELGITDEGWVEITNGLAVWSLVRLPG